MTSADRPVGRALGLYLKAGRVKADIFDDRTNWKYAVFLDYTASGAIEYLPRHEIDPKEAAILALKVASRRKTSGVAFETLPDGWVMSVPEPPDGPAVLVQADPDE